MLEVKSCFSLSVLKKKGYKKKNLEKKKKEISYNRIVNHPFKPSTAIKLFDLLQR